ncbi:MAG: methyl-accepting chemotaxis protein [Thalassobaculaceae bacterium]
MTRILSRLSVAAKLTALATVTAFAVIGLSAMSLYNGYHQLRADRLEMVKAVVDSTRSYADSVYARADSGEITEDEAFALLRGFINGVRFNGGDYLFAYSMDGVGMIHPINASLEGKSLLGVTDKNGTHIVQEMVDGIEADGDAVVEYYWQKPGVDGEVLKLSYAVGFPQRDMFFGSGIYVDDLNAAFVENATQLGIISAVILAAALSLAGLTVVDLRRGIGGLRGAMIDLADGNLEVQVPGTDRRDEIGAMARTVEVFRENAIQKAAAEARQIDLEREAEAKRAALLSELADGLDAKVSAIVRDLGEGVQGMTDRIGTLRGVTDGARAMSQDVAATTEQTTANMQSVAAASDEMSSTAAEISRQVTLSTEVVGEAGDTASAAADQVARLSESADKIGEVVGLITDIAEQTNLLALNATIEAARAGDAGKGFAVVASEVKNLANQTAKATEEISEQIGSIQGATKDAVTAIQGISKTINEVNEIASAISAAVEEQGAATNEIARNVEQAAQGTQDVTTNITKVTEGAGETGQAAGQVLEAAGELSKQAEFLRGEVDNFLNEVRAA